MESETHEGGEDNMFKGKGRAVLGLRSGNSLTKIDVNFSQYSGSPLLAKSPGGMF